MWNEITFWSVLMAEEFSKVLEEARKGTPEEDEIDYTKPIKKTVKNLYQSLRNF